LPPSETGLSVPSIPWAQHLRHKENADGSAIGTSPPADCDSSLLLTGR